MLNRDEVARQVAAKLQIVDPSPFKRPENTPYLIWESYNVAWDALIDSELRHEADELRIQQADEEIANLRAEDDGDLRIHDKLQMAEECIDNWTRRCELAQHKFEDAELRIQELREALRALVEQFHAYENGWIDGKPENWRIRIGLPGDLKRAEALLSEEKK